MAHEAKQNDDSATVGAVSREAGGWYAINWQVITATFADSKCVSCRQRKESRWGKVRALQRLLTHSYSGKVLAFDE